jgi:KTSC domain
MRGAYRLPGREQFEGDHCRRTLPRPHARRRRSVLNLSNRNLSSPSINGITALGGTARGCGASAVHLTGSAGSGKSALRSDRCNKASVHLLWKVKMTLTDGIRTAIAAKRFRFERSIVTQLVALLLQGTSSVTAQSANEACVKYYKCVPLDKFTCSQLVDSDVHRVCYAEQVHYMVVWLGKHDTPYHICDIGSEVVAQLLKAPSKGDFYDANIRSSSTEGKYDCRNHSIPKF